MHCVCSGALATPSTRSVASANASSWSLPLRCTSTPPTKQPPGPASQVSPITETVNGISAGSLTNASPKSVWSLVHPNISTEGGHLERVPRNVDNESVNVASKRSFRRSPRVRQHRPSRPPRASTRRYPTKRTEITVRFQKRAKRPTVTPPARSTKSMSLSSPGPKSSSSPPSPKSRNGVAVNPTAGFGMK